MRGLLVAILLGMLAPVLSAQEYVWREAEDLPLQAPFQAGGWGHPEYLSGQKWVHAAIDANQVQDKVPAEGVTFTFELPVKEFGQFDLWARIGYEFARVPFRWRVDEGEWTTVRPEQFTTDLMALADFTEVAWLKLGTRDLAAGTRKLTVHVPRPSGGRFLFALDCVLATRTPFVPNGPHKPDAEWQSPADRRAGEIVYEFSVVPGLAHVRRTLQLGGTWQVARFDEPGDVVDRTGPIAELPDLKTLHWSAIRVPGNKDSERPDLAYCHRLLYRTRVSIPQDAQGRSLVLRFPNNALLTTVWVNGQRVGFSDTPCAAYECDISRVVRPGEVHEIIVGIKDLYYALAQVDTPQKSCRWLFNFPTERFMSAGGLGPTRFADYPVLFQVRRSGILETPTLTLAGPVYAADVFPMTSVSRQELAVETTLKNPGTKVADISVSHAVFPREGDRGKPVVNIAATHHQVPPGGNQTFTTTTRWESPRLWWPDDPHMYVVVTTIEKDGATLDIRKTPFGFREWGWKGRQFTLNGVPWQLRADLRHNDRDAKRNPEEAVREWRKNGQNMFRLWGERPWTGTSQTETLRFFDQAGVPVRRSGIFDGQVASYQLVIDGQPHKALFDNWRKQLAAWVKAERNHPSIFIWSLENEITYINTRNFGWLKPIEPEIKKAAELVMQIDPTRPVMVDGGDALMDQSLPVAGNHYLERDKRDYPTEAYTLKRAYSQHEEPRARDPWPIPKDKPLFLGESFYANGSPPSAYAEIDGEAAFLGRGEAARGVARFARILSEGYRWHGVAAFHFWFAEGADAEHYQAWQPVCVLCREWDTAFPAGEPLTRTLKAFNDTRHASPITVHWLIQTKNVPNVQQLRGKRTLELAPGKQEEFTISVPLPSVDRPTEAEFVVSCERDGVEVFRDARPCRLLPRPMGKVTNATAEQIALWDPQGKVTPLVQRLTACTVVKSPDALPAGCKLLIVGPDALNGQEATDPSWTALATRGIRLVVLDQEHPLHYLAVPADLEATPHTGRIAFPENLQHPILKGLTRNDFFCWTGDETVYRHAYRKPGRGGRSLVQCDVELSHTALVEVPIGESVMILSQLAIGHKPESVVGQTLVANMLRHAWEYRREARPTYVVLPEGDIRRQALTATGLKFQVVEDPMNALQPGAVAIVDGTPANLRALTSDREAIATFTQSGGRLVLWGVTPEGLADFNRLVGQEHVMRPFRLERVTLPAVRPPLLAGLSLRDVALESNERIYPWSGDRYPADDTFTHVVDLDDIAPFVQSDRFADGWSKMTNGLTSADSWKFIFYHDQGQAGERPRWAGRFPKPVTLTGLTIIINGHYRRLTQVRVTFDDDPASAILLDLKPQEELKQKFTFPPRTCQRISLEPVAWTEGSKPVTGVDNLWLHVQQSKETLDRVVPLLNVGAMVWYPQEKGGILLNQLRIQENEPNPVNVGKKRTLLATLLGNLEADFEAGRLLVPGANLVYAPIPLGEKCNSYLVADKGWVGGKPDLAAFPVGEQTFAGVRYAIRDFRTSPLPTAITLVGRGNKVTETAVRGIPVGKTADVLYFLHTYHRVKEWKPPQPWERNKPKDPPVVVRYVVRYADGMSEAIPVRLGVGIDHWIASAAKGLRQASVGWTAPLAATGASEGRQAVVYTMPWTNPHPEKAIASVDVELDREVGSQYGVPVLLGVTAATERK